MKLKIKSWIYRVTGIYLAYREELEYLESDEFWTVYKKMWNRKANDLHPRDIQGILVGMWQVKHGFVRRFR